MNPELVSNLQQAAALFSRGRLEEAEDLCRRLLSAWPDATDTLHLLALILKQRSEYAEAEKMLRACIDNEPRRADIRANLGNLLAASGRAREAADAYREALSIKSSFRPARLGLARVLMSTGDPQAAAREARRLIDQDARDAEAWNVLGTARRLQGQMGKAEAAFQKALSCNPNYAIARHNLGALLGQLSRSEEAMAELDAALALGVSGPELDFNRASVLMALGRFDEAQNILQNTVRSNPGDVQAHTLLARIRYMRGRSDFAEEFAAAVKDRQDDVALLLGFSRVLRGAGNFDEALASVHFALNANIHDPRLLAELAAIHQDAGSFADALRCARAAADADPDTPGLDDILIDALTCLGQAEEAKPLVEAARRRRPLNQWNVAMEATVARLLGDPRYGELYDYEAFVRPYDLEPPEGWTSIEDFHRDLIPALKERHRFQAEPLDQSLRHGTQTPRGLLGDPHPVIQAFLKAILAPIARYREEIGFDPKHPFLSRNEGECELIGCWSVRLKRGGFHVNHVHSEGWISSAYYVEVPPEVADDTSRSGWIKFGEPRFKVPGATADKFIQPRAGRLVLFPSYMWHGTVPITGNEPRMTIAFDVVPRACGAGRTHA